MSNLGQSVLRYVYDKWFYYFGDINNTPGIKLVLESRGDIDAIYTMFTNGKQFNMGTKFSLASVPTLVSFKVPELMSRLKKDIDQIPNNGDLKTIYGLANDLYNMLISNRDTFKKIFKMDNTVDEKYRMKDQLFGVAFYTYCACAMLNILAEVSMYTALIKFNVSVRSTVKNLDEKKIRELLAYAARDSKRYILVKGVLEFAKRPSFKKDLEDASLLQREAILKEDFMGVFSGALLVSFIILALRLMVEAIYYSRSEVSKWLEAQSTYLELNANILASQNEPNNEKVIEKQRLLVEKMRHLSTLIRVSNEKMDKELEVKDQTMKRADEMYKKEEKVERTKGFEDVARDNVIATTSSPIVKNNDSGALL